MFVRAGGDLASAHKQDVSQYQGFVPGGWMRKSQVLGCELCVGAGANDVVVQPGSYNRRDALGTEDDFYVSEGRVCLLCGNGRVIVLPAMPGLG